MTRTTTARTPPAMTQTRVRRASLFTLGFVLFGSSAWGAGARGRVQQTGQHPAPVVRQAPPSTQHPANTQGDEFVAHSGQNQEHLQQWMQSHSNLTLEQQQHALDNEPGFRQLSPEMQQRMHQRLTQLNAMTPQQRQRTYARTEAMERLAPEQRLQVRNALTNLGNLPKDRRAYVAQEFRALRDMPAGQRQAFLNSPIMRSQFSNQELQVLNGLFQAAPYLPPPASAPPMPGPLPPR